MARAFPAVPVFYPNTVTVPPPASPWQAGSFRRARHQLRALAALVICLQRKGIQPHTERRDTTLSPPGLATSSESSADVKTQWGAACQSSAL